MFKSCELYYCDGLYIDQEMAKSLSLQKTNSIGFLSLLENYDIILSIKNGNVSKADKTMLIKKIQKQLMDDGEICYLVRENSLIVPDITVYYGISDDESILALYDKKRIRDAKLSVVKCYDARNIIDDMSRSNDVLNKYNEQKRLRKIYYGLKG